MITAKTFGEDDLKKAFEKIEAQTKAKIAPDALTDMAQPVLDRAKKLVPVRTGKLRASLQIGEATTENGTASISVGSPSPVMHLVELGAVNQAAQPFLRPAVFEQAQALTRKFGDKFGQDLERIARVS